MKAIINLTAALLMLASVMLMLLAQDVLAAQDQQAINETRQVSANEKITIEAMRGEVRIRAGADNTFVVKGLLDELAEGFELESANGFTRFVVLMPRSVRGWRNEDGNDLEFIVPANSDVEFSGVNAEVQIADILGGTKVTTVNGDIVAANLGGVIELKTVNGPIRSSNVRGRVSLQTVNGEISDSRSAGRLNASTVNGSMEIDSAAEEVRISMVNGEVDATLNGAQLLEFDGINGQLAIHVLNSMSPRIKGSSVSGQIELRLDRDIDARFNLRTSVGSRIDNGISNDQAVRPQYGPGRSLQFTTGQGNGSVELTTVSGAIEVRGN
ncbi:MAG: hypothetical protein Q8L06_03310 [Pseudohongiella sp.]|nr:hypothetical protein [Pseudohongiella sp.]